MLSSTSPVMGGLRAATGTRLGAVLLLTASLAACEGDAGPAGPAGPQGPEGPAGQPGDGTLDPALSTVDKAYLGVGGKEALTALTSVRITSTGSRLLVDEGFAPGDTSAEASTFELTQSYDLAQDGLRLDYERMIAFPFPAQTMFSEIIKGDLGYIVGAEGIFGGPAGANMPSDRWAAVRKQQRLLNPQLILRDVAATPELATPGGYELHDGVVHERLIVDQPVHDVTLYVNPATGHISKLSTLENDHLHRDSVVEVYYADWQPTTGGVAFPNQVFLALDGNLLHIELRDTVEVNVELAGDLLAFPADASPEFDQAAADRGAATTQFLQQFASIGVPQEGLQVNVTADELAEGVFHLVGGSHHSLAIEQSNGIVIVEAPLYPERSEAIIAWAETEFPDKEITHVISTHHHADHAAGLRAFVAKGATVVVSEKSRDFLSEIFRAPSTIVPDSLAAAPAKANFQTVEVDGFVTLGDATRPVGAYHVRTTHANDLLMIYLPNEKIAFTSDIFSPAFPPGPGATELYESILEHGIAVDTIAGGHGTGTATFAELEAIANPQ